MALPICDKVWTFPVINQVCGGLISGATDNKTSALNLKNGLKLAGWTVWGSSDGVTASTTEDGVDRWTDITKIPILNGGAHGWCVLKNTALAPNAAYLIDMNDPNSNAYSFTHKFSVTGFGLANGGVNGTTSLAPTSAAAGQHYTQPKDGFLTSSLHKETMSIIASSDRECTRVFITDASSGASITVLMFEKAKNPATEWTIPVVSVSYTGASFNALTLGGSSYMYSKQGATALDLRPTCEGYSNQLLCNSPVAADDASADWPMLPSSLVCVTAGHRNWRKGQIYDFWWGSTSIATGDTYPTTAGQQRKFIQIGQGIHPWNGLVTPDGTAIILD